MMLSQDEWAERFPLVDSPGGDQVWEHKETLSIPLERVWTIVSGDDDGLYVTPGYRLVNRLGYVVTKDPWPDLDIEGVWDEPREEEEEPDNRATAKQPEREAEEMDIFDKLQRELDAARAEGDKFYNNGNAAAGTRSRGHLQSLVVLAKEGRVAIQKEKNS